MAVRNVAMLCAFDTVMVLGRSFRRQTNVTEHIQPCRLFYILNMEKPNSVPWNILTDEHK
jgi:hypothetical protein